MEEEKKKKNNSLILIIVIILILIIATILYFVFSNNDSDNSTVNTIANESTTDDMSDTDIENSNEATNSALDNATDNDTETNNSNELIPLITFTEASTDWYAEVWFNSSENIDEITYGTEGVTFTSGVENSRLGIMTDVETDVSDYSELNLHLIASVQDQKLTGTGWDGREAPVSVAVGYTDTEGIKHNGLGIDPTVPTHVFWRGLYTLDPDEGSGTTNGIKVSTDEKYTFDFDLMTLNPKPVTIHYVAVEGSGWPSRQGTVHEISLIAK